MACRLSTGDGEQPRARRQRLGHRVGIMCRYRPLHAAAATQGYVDLRTAHDRYGINRPQAYRHLDRCGWQAILPGLVAPPDAVLSHEVRARIAQEHFGPPMLFTAATALYALGIVETPPERVHILLPGNRWQQPRDGLCFHYTAAFRPVRSVAWPDAELRVTAAARSLAEHSRHVDATQLCKDTVAAIRLRHCGLPQLAAELAVRARFPGRTLLRRVHGELSGELNHSDYERLGRRLLREQGVVVPSRPMPVIHNQVPIAEIDLPFFDVRYGVEVDGPAHLLPE